MTLQPICQFFTRYEPVSSRILEALVLEVYNIMKAYIQIEPPVVLFLAQSFADNSTY